MDYDHAAARVAGIIPRTAREERRASVARAFMVAEAAYRVAGPLRPAPARTSYIKKEKGKWCVKSEKNPGWSGGCYGTRAEAEGRLKQVEMFKHMGSIPPSDGDWVPAAGGKEEPFTARDGRRLQYMWNPVTKEHAYLDLDTDVLLSDDEAWKVLGSSVAAGVTFKSAPEYESVEAFVEYKMDDEDEEYDHEDLAALNYRLNRPIKEIRSELESFGLKLKGRAAEKKSRGFQSPDHDRWYGPGSDPTHGGGGAGSKWIPSAT
jgi:hypothetical protein